jgi:hypothetical protein
MNQLVSIISADIRLATQPVQIGETYFNFDLF